MKLKPEIVVKTMLQCGIMPTGSTVIFLDKDPMIALQKFYCMAIENYKKEILDSICIQRDLFEEDTNDGVSKSKNCQVFQDNS